MTFAEHINTLFGSLYDIRTGNGEELADFITTERVKKTSMFLSHKGGVASEFYENSRYANFTEQWELWVRVQGDASAILRSVCDALNADNSFDDATVKVLGYSWLFDDKNIDCFQVAIEVSR
jgi:hypothetical protein